MARKHEYLVIAEQLRQRIETCELGPGDRLPSEREMVQDFNVARMTVRRALGLLQEEGLVERRRGRTGGTFARPLPPVVDVGSAEGLLHQLEHHGMRVRSELVDTGERVPPRMVALGFGTEPDVQIPMREMVQFADDRPVMAESAYLRPGRESEFEGLAASSLTCALGEDPAAHRSREDLVMPTVASEKECTLLGLSTPAPLQRIVRKVWEDGELLSYSAIVLRTDSVTLRVSH